MSKHRHNPYSIFYNPIFYYIDIVGIILIGTIVAFVVLFGLSKHIKNKSPKANAIPLVQVQIDHLTYDLLNIQKEANDEETEIQGLKIEVAQIEKEISSARTESSGVEGHADEKQNDERHPTDDGNISGGNPISSPTYNSSSRNQTRPTLFPPNPKRNEWSQFYEDRGME
jgi:hypothetical protein